MISRVAHRAYFLDEYERTRLVDFVRRVAEFSGVKLLAYSVMSNHFHVFVYIGRPDPLSDAEIVRRISALYSDVRFEQVMKKWNELASCPDSPSFRRYRASFLLRMWNASEFMKTLKQQDFTLCDSACWGVVFKCCDGVEFREYHGGGTYGIHNSAIPHSSYLAAAIRFTPDGKCIVVSNRAEKRTSS